MASKLSFLALLMERKKAPKENNNNNNNNNKKKKKSTNDLAFVKAAAWAWYQHNSGSKGKTISEFDATITRRSPRPSRYKLEAMRILDQEPLRANKLSLLDEYEVQSISRQLNGLVQSCNSNNNTLVNGADKSTDRRVQKKKVRKGFWLRHGAVCGREGDVVHQRAFRVPRSLPEKH